MIAVIWSQPLQPLKQPEHHRIINDRGDMVAASIASETTRTSSYY